MGVLAKLWGLITKAFGKDDEERKAPPVRGPDPRPFLTGSAPGIWSSDHLAESSAVTGWQFVAIRALAKMASQAELTIHRLDGRREERSRLPGEIHEALAIGDTRHARHLKARLKRIRAELKAEAAPDSNKPDRKPVRPNHPLLRLLQRPNPEWSLNTLLFAGVQQLSATGSCLLWAVRNGMGAPVELYVLPTGLVTMRMPTPEYPKGSYYLRPLSAWGLNYPAGNEWMTGTLGQALMTGCEIDARDVKPVRWPHPIYLTDGLSPLQAGRLWVDVANEMDRANWYCLQNAERPGMLFSMDPTVNPDPADLVQFREDLRMEAAGTPNTGKHLVMPKGLTADPRGRIPTDMDYANGRPSYRDMNLALHAISPIAAGITESGSYAAFWAAIKQTTELSVQPMLSLIAGELTEFLCEAYGDGRCEITLTARAIDDPQVLHDRARVYIQARNALTANEFRALFGFSPLPPAQGDQMIGDPGSLDNRLRVDILAGNAVTVNEYRALRGLLPLPPELGDQFVGMRTSVKLEDANPEEPGIQDGAGKDDVEGSADKKPDKDTTGTRQPEKDAAPGRQDRNGKSHGWPEGERFGSLMDQEESQLAVSPLTLAGNPRELGPAPPPPAPRRMVRTVERDAEGWVAKIIEEEGMARTSDHCEHCGSDHRGACPRVSAIEYHPNGVPKRVEYCDPHDKGEKPPPCPPPQSPSHGAVVKGEPT